MKKLLLIVALLFASYGAFADEFDDIVAAMRQTSGNKSLPDTFSGSLRFSGARLKKVPLSTSYR